MQSAFDNKLSLYDRFEAPPTFSIMKKLLLIALAIFSLRNGNIDFNAITSSSPSTTKTKLALTKLSDALTPIKSLMFFILLATVAFPQSMIMLLFIFCLFTNSGL